MSLVVISSCSDDEIDTSLLVGTWDSCSIYQYDNGELVDHNDTPGFICLIFDGKKFDWGGPSIQTIGNLKQKYSYDKTMQVITLSDGTKMNILNLTESILEIEEIFKNDTTDILVRSTYERRMK